MRVLITGAGGQLGQGLVEALDGHETIPLTHAELDICNGPKLRRVLQESSPHCVINTAAFHEVDYCEEAVSNAFAVNAVGVHNLVAAANKQGCALVHISTDYVFDGSGNRPYREDDQPHPQSVYAMSKYAGELIVLRYARAGYLIRTCGLYGLAGVGGKGTNFVETMLRLANQGKTIRVVSDQIVTPTNANELAQRLRPLIESGKFGLYHMSNNGQCSWHEFAGEIFRLSGLTPNLQAVTAKEFGAAATRPAYSVLDNGAYRNAGFEDFRPWKEALAEYLEQRRKHKK